MQLLPQSFEFQTANLLPGRLKEQRHSSSQLAVRFFSKSLPHLLPRQAFCFWAMSSSKAGTKSRQFSFGAYTDAGMRGANLKLRIAVKPPRDCFSPVPLHLI